MSTPGVTVGELRRLLDRATGMATEHYAIASTTGQGLSVLGCCDRLDETVLLLRGALGQLTGSTPPGRSSPYVVVNRDDLAALLAGKAGTGARDRLGAAARA